MSTDTTPDNVLFEWYGRYIGDPETETDVYLGFALFFGGIAMGAVGIAVFLLSAVFAGDQSMAFAFREVAVVAAAGGLPILLLGVVVLLPGDRRVTYAALGGLIVCGVAIAVFVSAYPMQWNVDRTPDYSAQGVAIYAAGLVAVVGATGSALVGHQVERASVGGEATPASGAADGSETGESVTDEQVRADIDEAMAGTDISWGGVEKSETRRLELNTETVDDIDRTSFENASATTTRAAGVDVDDAVSGLQQLKGEEAETASGSGVDDQTAALTELKKQKRAEQLATKDDGVLDRLKGLFS